MRKTVLFFVSEVLSAQALAPVIRSMRARRDWNVLVANDGFCRDYVASLGIDFVSIENDFERRIEPLVERSDIVVLGKSYRQSSEYALLRCAGKKRIRAVMVLPDMGSEIIRTKLFECDGSGGFPKPFLMLSDPHTYYWLRSEGWPEDKAIPVGSPYYDLVYRQAAPRERGASRRVAYFATAFHLDHQRGLFDVPYSPRDYVLDIRRAVESLGLELVAKRHPQVPSEVFEGVEVFEGTAMDLITSVGIVVGNYSSALLEAYAAAVPCISYQPWPKPVRKDVFAERIPIVRNEPQLRRQLRLASRASVSGEKPRHITFAPGRSIERIIAVLDSLACPSFRRQAAML